MRTPTFALAALLLASAACGAPTTATDDRATAPEQAAPRIVDVTAADLRVARFAVDLRKAGVYRFADPASSIATDRVDVIHRDGTEETLLALLTRGFQAESIDVSGDGSFLIADDDVKIPEPCALKCWGATGAQLNVCPTWCASLRTGNPSNDDEGSSPARTTHDSGCTDPDDGTGGSSGGGSGSNSNSDSGGSGSSSSSSSGSGASGGGTTHGGVANPGGGL